MGFYVSEVTWNIVFIFLILSISSIKIMLLQKYFNASKKSVLIFFFAENSFYYGF